MPTLKKPFIFSQNIPFLLCILFLITLAVYGNTLFHEFVWDDHYLIEYNEKLRDNASIKDFFTKDFWENASIPYQSGFYRPFTLMSFFINYQIWGNNPFGYHLFNVLCHAINAMLIFLIFHHLTQKRILSFFTAVLFIVHPIQTETVAFISDVGDLLCVLFLLSCFRFFLLYIKEGRALKNLLLSNGFLLAALFSKENAMMGTFLILLIDFFFVSNLRWTDFKSKWKIFASYFGVTAAYVIARIMILGVLNAVTTLENVRYVSVLPSYGAWSHILTTAKILFLYIQLLVFPIQQTISYVVLPATGLLNFDVFLPVVFLLCLVALIATCFKEQYKWISFSWIWFFMTILPLSNLIPISNTIAERFLYLPMIGFSFFIAYGVSVIIEKKAVSKEAKITGCVLITILLLFLSAKTFTRNLDWKSNFTLFTSAKHGNPCSPIAHLNLSTYYNREGDSKQGSAEYGNYLACKEIIKNEHARLRKLTR